MFNFCIGRASFPKADIISFDKKDDTNNKDYYRAVSILPSLSKAFKKCLHDQISAYTDTPNVVLEKAAGLSIQLMESQLGSR